MEYKKTLKFKSLRLLRICMDYISSLIFGFLCDERKQLPPIRDEVLLLSATILAEKIRKKEIKSVDVLSAYIARIKDVQPILNAVTENRFDAALEEARQVDELIASGTKSEDELKKSTPLLGVPVTTKEHISVKGMRCTNGLVAFKDKISSEDAVVVKALREAGGIIIATTNLPEMSASMECYNKIYGRTVNPYDTRRTCGGSSGGEGALIAAAGSIVGIGTDYGGSIRIPASLNGLFGHKSSSGVVPSGGVGSDCCPERLFKYNVVGPMCRYSEDLLLMMKILTKNDPKLKLDEPVDLKELRIYYSDDLGNCPLATPVKPAVHKAMKMALNHFEDRYGIKPVRVHPELLGLLENGFLYWMHTVSANESPTFNEVLREFKGRKNLPMELTKWCCGLSDHTLQTLCCAVAGDIFVKNSEKHEIELKNFEPLRDQFNHILKENCVFLYPIQPEPAPFHNENMFKVFNASYAALFNALLYPATTIPILLSQGLPVGIQCVANIYNDRLNIAVAQELGKAFGGWHSPSLLITS